MTGIRINRTLIVRAMRAAAVRGFDPRNSHSAMSREYERLERFAPRLTIVNQDQGRNSEAEANRWLADQVGI